MANTYVKIASVSVGSGGQASMDFNSIPATYTDLLIKISTRIVATSDFPALVLRFNGSSAANYSTRWLLGSGSAASSGSSSAGTSMRLGNTDGSLQTASTFGNFEVYIPNYAGSTNKSVSVDAVSENNATAGYQNLVAGLWSNTAAITSISLLEITPLNIAQYSTATLYGIKKN
jgi:hypothetical protein